MPPPIAGHWKGHFVYGPEYGAIAGERVTFDLVLEETGNGAFRGKCIEWEGAGFHEEIATLNGYVTADRIHFRKEYPTWYEFGEDGSRRPRRAPNPPLLTYDGTFHEDLQAYRGRWAIETAGSVTAHGSESYLCTGTWEMHPCP